MSQLPKHSVISEIGSLIEFIGSREKQATDMGLTGDAKKDPGGWKGPSTHPSARAASNVESTPLGSRAKENEADVKHDQPIGVDSTSPKSGGSQDDKQMNIGTHQSATGEDPSVENHYKGDKDDEREGDRGGTSGPFDAERVGEKYSSMRFEDLVKVAFDRQNRVLSDIAERSWEKDGSFDPFHTGVKPPTGTATTPAAPPHAPASADRKSPIAHTTAEPLLPKQAAEMAAAAGYALADLSKKAAVQDIISNTIRDAELNANLTYDMITKYADYCERFQKRAEDGPMAGPMGAMDGGGAGGPPPAPPMGGGGGDPMGGGGGDPAMAGPAGDAGAGAGGPPPGGDPSGGGGAPPGAGGGAGEGQVDEIINALLQMGATPEEIMQALQQDTGGAAGGAPGAPPEGEAGKQACARLPHGVLEAKRELFAYCKAASERFRQGAWVPRAVKNSTKEAQEREQLQNYILEVVNAGR